MTKGKITLSFFICLLILSGCAATRTISTTITSEPPGANIYWGKTEGQLAKTGHKTPYISHIAGPNPFWYSLYYQVRKEGYKDSPIKFQSKTEGDRILHFKLEPLELKARYGAFSIASDPAGAHITDKESGQYLGVTPTKIWHFKVESQKEPSVINKTFVLQKRNYHSAELNLTLRCEYKTKSEAENNFKSLFVMLEPISEEPPMTRILITSEPSGASVYSAGKLLGKTPLYHTINWLPSKSSVDLVYEMTGFESKLVIINPDDKEVHVVLEPTSTVPR